MRSKPFNQSPRPGAAHLSVGALALPRAPPTRLETGPLLLYGRLSGAGANTLLSRLSLGNLTPPAPTRTLSLALCLPRAGLASLLTSLLRCALFYVVPQNGMAPSVDWQAGRVTRTRVKRWRGGR